MVCRIPLIAVLLMGASVSAATVPVEIPAVEGGGDAEAAAAMVDYEALANPPPPASNFVRGVPRTDPPAPHVLLAAPTPLAARDGAPQNATSTPRIIATTGIVRDINPDGSRPEDDRPKTSYAWLYLLMLLPLSGLAVAAWRAKRWLSHDESKIRNRQGLTVLLGEKQSTMICITRAERKGGSSQWLERDKDRERAVAAAAKTIEEPADPFADDGHEEQLVTQRILSKYQGTTTSRKAHGGTTGA